MKPGHHGLDSLWITASYDTDEDEQKLDDNGTAHDAGTEHRKSVCGPCPRVHHHRIVWIPKYALYTTMKEQKGCTGRQREIRIFRQVRLKG